MSINEVKFVKFEKMVPRRIVSLRVRGLSACSVIILVSDHAAIMAYVGPNIPGSSDEDTTSFRRLANNKIDELERLYRTNQRYFGDDSHVYLIYATLGGTTASL